jgi:hypothetical protein
VRNRYPHSSSLRQLENILQDEWYNILLETVQNLYKPFTVLFVYEYDNDRNITL